jgi:hypothetical protein
MRDSESSMERMEENRMSIMTDLVYSFSTSDAEGLESMREANDDISNIMLECRSS